VESTPDLSEIRGCHCLAARKRARSITRVFEEGLRPHGLRATQYSVLAVLSLKGPTRVGEMSELLGLDRTSVTRTVAVMRRNEWVADGRSKDARERVLQVTPQGRSKLVEAFPAWKEAQERVGREFGLEHSG
jgi:DNA-binding MarR family transcriptional regulator